MNSSGFINEDNGNEKIEILGISSATSNTFKRRINGKLYFMKQLRPEYATEKRYREAFFKEYNTGKDIYSPYVAKYVSIEEDTDELYILMEYINGVTLKDKLSHEPEYFHKSANIRKLLLQISKALTALHSRGIVHLDIKPDNILLTKTTNDVRLVDLGFCLSNNNDHTIGCTRTFAAPETIAGDIAEIDARSDIYSVGCLLQYIEETSGKRLNHKFCKIKNCCLHKQKCKRYTSASDIIATLNDFRRWFYVAGIVALVALSVSLFTKSPLYDNLCNLIDWEFGNVPERFEADGIFYHITDGDARTVEVTFKGNHHDEYLYEYKGGEINIPQSVTYKGRRFRVTAFAPMTFNNPYISKVKIPDGIEEIADSAFIYCNQNGTIRIPKSVKKIGLSAFFPMLYIDNIVVDEENPYYDSRMECNAIIETTTNTLIAGCYNTTIPEGVKRIAQDAFVGAKRLNKLVLPASLQKIGASAFVHSGIEQIEIPEGVTKLEAYTFQYCENLQKIALPQSLRSIGHAAISHCALKELDIPDSVTHIDDYACDYCEYLETLTIGSGVRHIGYAAFDGCRKLRKVVSHIPANELFNVNMSVFDKIDPGCVLYVPRGAKQTYAKTLGWGVFARIVEMEDKR